MQILAYGILEPNAPNGDRDKCAITAWSSETSFFLLSTLVHSLSLFVTLRHPFLKSTLAILYAAYIADTGQRLEVSRCTTAVAVL